MTFTYTTTEADGHNTILPRDVYGDHSLQALLTSLALHDVIDFRKPQFNELYLSAATLNIYNALSGWTFGPRFILRPKNLSWESLPFRYEATVTKQTSYTVKPSGIYYFTKSQDNITALLARENLVIKDFRTVRKGDRFITAPEGNVSLVAIRDAEKPIFVRYIVEPDTQAGSRVVKGWE
jgi:hypothetical protein